MFHPIGRVLFRRHAEACVEVLVRYVSWFGSWIARLTPASAPQRGREQDARASAQLSNEDLFYIAMLGPHV